MLLHCVATRFFNYGNYPLERTTAMDNYEQTRKSALLNNFRDEGQLGGSAEIVFSHLRAKDGSLYELTRPTSAEELGQAAVVHNCLFIKVMVEPDNPLSVVNIFSTARLTEFYDRTSWMVRRVFGKAPEAYSGPWIQTQNAKYQLVQLTKQ